MKRIKYQLNQKINNLTFLEETEPKNGVRKGKFKCFCGTIFITNINQVARGDSLSCGCLQRKATTKHGLYKHRLFGRWQNMIQRCNNPNDKDYKNYGGRGIRVCEQWENSFLDYYNWALSNGYEESLTIDRINNNDGYNPDNCRFISIAENNRNRPQTKLNWDLVNEIRNVKLLFGGLISSREIAKSYNVSARHIRGVLNKRYWRD